MTQMSASSSSNCSSHLSVEGFDSWSVSQRSVLTEEVDKIRVYLSREEEDKVVHMGMERTEINNGHLQLEKQDYYLFVKFLQKTCPKSVMLAVLYQ